MMDGSSYTFFSIGTPDEGFLIIEFQFLEVQDSYLQELFLFSERIVKVK